MSQSVLISTFFSCANPRLSELPWPRIPMLAVTTRSFAPRILLPTFGAACTVGRKNSPPTASPAAAAPSRDAKSRREIPLLSFSSLATVTSSLWNLSTGRRNPNTPVRGTTVPRYDSLSDHVRQRPNLVNRDPDLVTPLQREIVGRHDARSGQQDAAVREAHLAIEVFDERRRVALHLGQARRGREHRVAAAANLERDPCVLRRRTGRDHQRGAERAGTVVQLRLRKIERGLSFDVPRAHAVTRGVADDRAAACDEQRQLRLGDVPKRVAPDADRTARADDPPRGGLEEELRTFGGVHEIVEVPAGSGLRLFHPRSTAAEVRHARRPDLLVNDRREQLLHPRLVGRLKSVERCEVDGQIVALDERGRFVRQL